MICPHCSTGVRFDWKTTQVLNIKNGTIGTQSFYATCPECEEMILYLQEGIFDARYNRLCNIKKEEMIYPKNVARPVAKEVLKKYAVDFNEAVAVLRISPKASAALSRRNLQHILRDEFKVKRGSLEKEIEEFINLNGVPSHLSDAVDAIRNIGNFAAHPIKNTNTGEIEDVEPGEAEWLLDVLEALFDFAFIQPKKLEERRDKLNQKLKKAGKPKMK